MPASPQQQQRQQDTSSAPHPPLPPDHLTWTAEHEARLVLVQRQLRIAQARWSEEQDLWIDEVTHLENLKRKCLKAGKKKKVGSSSSVGPVNGGGGRRPSLGGMLKRGSWKGKKGLSPTESSFDTPRKAEDVDGEDDEGEEEEAVEGEDDATETPTSPSPRRPSISTLLKRTMSMGSKSAGSSRRNTFDFGQPAVRPSLMQSPVGSYSSGDVKGKGKVLSRRGTGL